MTLRNTLSGKFALVTGGSRGIAELAALVDRPGRVQ